jgi:GTP-binding protein HflX
MAQVNEVLGQIGAGSLPQLAVYNKIDRLHRAPAIERTAEGTASAVWISAQQRAGLDLLASAIAERLSRLARRARVRLPAGAGALRSRLYATKAVRDERTAEDGSIELAVELADAEIEALARTAGVEILEVRSADNSCAPAGGYLQSAAAARASKLR